MAMEVLTVAGQSGLALDEASDLIAAITELQGLRVDVVAGAGANTNIPITGILTTDTLLAVLMFAAGVPTKRSDASITSNGNIQVVGATTGNVLVVFWFNKDNA